MTVSARPIDTVAEPAAQPSPCFSRPFLPRRWRRLRYRDVLDEPDRVNLAVQRPQRTIMPGWTIRQTMHPRDRRAPPPANGVVGIVRRLWMRLRWRSARGGRAGA
jgi:hypothetical protein